MKRIVIVSVLISIVILGCGKNQIEKGKKVDGMLTSPEWDKKEIVNKEFGNWGSPIVCNDNYYFYATGNGIKRIEKISNEEKYIVRKKSAKMLLSMGEKCLYYVVPEEKKLYSVNFSGEKNSMLICGNDINNAELEYPDLLGLHVYNGKIYLMLGGLELCLFDEKTLKIIHVATDVRTGPEGFYKNIFYYHNSNKNGFFKIDLETLKKEMPNNEKDKMYYADQMIQYNNIIYFACKNEKRDIVYRYRKENDYDTILELPNKAWNFKFVNSDEDIYYVYDVGKYAGDETYLCCMNNSKLISDKLKMPKDYLHSLGIFEGYFFYESIKNNVETIKIEHIIQRQ